MKLTGRGRVLVAVIAVTVVMALLYGGRALDAIVLPGTVALLAAVVQLRRIDRPALSRRVPPSGKPDEEWRIELHFDTEGGGQFAARIDETVSGGLAASGNEADTTVGDGTPFPYTVRYDRRGEHELGPTRVTVTDLLGLVERTYVYWNRDTVTVYPRTRPVPDGLRSALATAAETSVAHGREAFDRLREYERGDPVRDVHWKSSAKLPAEDLLVAECSATERRERLHVAAQTMDHRADELAVVTASVVSELLDRGFAVGLSTAGGTVSPNRGTRQQDELLSRLAIVDTTPVPPAERSDADVSVHTPADGAAPIVSVHGTEYAFEPARDGLDTATAGDESGSETSGRMARTGTSGERTTRSSVRSTIREVIAS